MFSSTPLLTVFQTLLASSGDAFPYTSPTGITLDRASLCCDKHPSKLAASAALTCPGSGTGSLGSSLEEEAVEVSRGEGD